MLDHEAENGFNAEHEGKPFCGAEFRGYGCTQVQDHRSIHVARGSSGQVLVEWAR